MAVLTDRCWFGLWQCAAGGGGAPRRPRGENGGHERGERDPRLRVLPGSAEHIPLADASVWSRLADGSLLVTRKGTTEKRQLLRGIETLDKSKLLGALVNSSSNASHTDYYQRYSSPADQSTQ